MIRIGLMTLTPALMCAACAPTPSADNQSAPEQPLLRDEPERTLGAGSCDAQGLDDLVGRQGTSELASEAMKRSGAKKIRWTRPGMAMTMDYRTDRLNIDLDDNDIITGFKCG